MRTDPRTAKFAASSKRPFQSICRWNPKGRGGHHVGHHVPMVVVGLRVAGRRKAPACRAP